MACPFGNPLPTSSVRPGARAAVHLPADDEGLDVVPAVAVGDIRDALLELCEKVGEETVGAVLALAREGAEEERAAPCGHAPHVVPREDDGIVVPVGIVQTEELGALELEAGDRGTVTVEPRAVERLAEGIALQHPAVASASGRFGTDDLAVLLEVRRARDLPDTLRTVQRSVSSGLERHGLPTVPVNVTLTSYDHSSKRELN